MHLTCRLHSLLLGLSKMHEKGFLHRDLARRNILLTGEPLDEAHIADLGTAVHHTFAKCAVCSCAIVTRTAHACAAWFLQRSRDCAAVLVPSAGAARQPERSADIQVSCTALACSALLLHHYALHLRSERTCFGWA